MLFPAIDYLMQVGGMISPSSTPIDTTVLVFNITLTSVYVISLFLECF